MAHPKRSITRELRTRRPLHPRRESDEVESETWPEAGLRVADFMTRGIVTIHAGTRARDAAQVMRERRIRHLPVVDRGGKLAGIVTDRDLRQTLFDPAIRERVGEAAEALNALLVRDVMTWSVITIRPDSDLRLAANLMHEQKVGALPVVRQGKVVGILTESDVLKALVRVLGEGVLAKPYRWALAYR